MDEQEEKPKRVRRTKAQMEDDARAKAYMEMGVREDLAQAIMDIKPEQTPFIPVGVYVRTRKDIQMPREYLLDYHDIRDPKLVKGAIIHMKREWADLLVVAGKVERV